MFFPLVTALAYVCDYPEFELGNSHYLYKEELLPVVKWLPSFEYCRAKGDTSIYSDAGQAKCEYSRGICFWSDEGRVTGCWETFRENDSLEDCQALLANNELSTALDNGRMPQNAQSEPQSTQDVSFAASTHGSPFVLLLLNLV